jgi:hypothetical protein
MRVDSPAKVGSTRANSFDYFEDPKKGGLESGYLFKINNEVGFGGRNEVRSGREGAHSDDRANFNLPTKATSLAAAMNKGRSVSILGPKRRAAPAHVPSSSSPFIAFPLIVP